MSERRENLKRSLGITEYPWSSDDEEIETQAVPDHQRTPAVPGYPINEGEGRPSTADNPGTSGRVLPGLNLSGRGTRSDSFWSLTPNTRRPPFNSIRRDDVPLSLVSRAPGGGGGGGGGGGAGGSVSGASGGAADVRRILEIRRMRLPPAVRRPHPAGINMTHRNLSLPRNRNNALAASRFPRTCTQGHMMPSHPAPRRITTDGLDFNPVEVHEITMHLRTDLGRADLSTEYYHRPYAPPAPPAPAALRLTPPPPPPPLPPPPPPPANVPLPPLPPLPPTAPLPANEDDGFLEADVSSNRHSSPERPDSHMENDPPADLSERSVDASVEEGGGSGSLDTSAMSLEEVVEIEPPAGGPTGAGGTDRVDGETESPESATTAGGDLTRSKRESDDESDLGTAIEFNQNLLRLLECPVCLEWMEPPMWQCRRGHLVCSRCRARLATCPVCRTTFSSVRNRAMEGVAEIIRYPCRHGCPRNLKLRRRNVHEASCPARRYRCPATACENNPPLPHHDLLTHLQTRHKSMVKSGVSHTFTLRVTSTVERSELWVLLALGQVFTLSVELNPRAAGLALHVAYIGPQRRAQDYTYEVCVFGQRNSRKLSYMRATHSDLECERVDVTHKDCFVVSPEQLVNFLRVTTQRGDTHKLLQFTVRLAHTHPPDAVEDSD